MLGLSTVTQASALAAMIGVVALLPAVIEEFGISRTVAGVVATAPNLGLLLSLTAWGAVVDRFGSRATLGPAAIAAGGLIVLASRMPTIPLLTVLLALTGVAAAVSFPAGGRMVAHWFDERRGLAMGINQAFVPLAGLTTALVLPAIAGSAGWRAALLLSGAPAAVAGLGYVLLYRERPVGHEPVSRMSVRALLRNRGFLLITAGAMAFMVAQSALMSFLMPFLVQDLRWPVAAAGIALSAAQLGGLVGRFTWGGLGDRLLGNRHVLTWQAVGALGAAAALLLGRTASSWPAWVVLLLALFFGVACIGWNGLHVHLVTEVAGKARAGLAIGASLNFLQLTILVGTPAFGWIADHRGGYPMAWTTIAAVLVVAIAVLAAVRLEPVRAVRVGAHG